MIEIESYADARRFLALVGPGLELREAENSLMLGVALRLRDGDGTSDGGANFTVVRNDAEWLLAALLTPSRPLVLAAAMGIPRAALSQLADQLRRTHTRPPGVIGSGGLAQAFASEWLGITACTVGHTMWQRIYQLTAVRDDLPIVEGRLRRASEMEREVVSCWMGDFEAEALGERDGERSRQTATQRIERGEIFLWEVDGEPRSMAGQSRPTRNTISVNAVYTPRLWRRQGLATATVAELSRQLLGDGYSSCVLYTDLANPTSNSIYQRIGYVPVADSAHLHFR